jgi:hypothetical protein
MISVPFSWKPILPALAALLVLACAPAAAKTTVTVEGTTVVIHVPIEVAGLSPKMTVTVPADTEVNGDKIPAGTKMNGAEYLQQLVMKIWNDALEGFKSGDCLTFRLDLQLFPVDWAAPHQPGRHRIQFDVEDPPDSYPAALREAWVTNSWDPTGPDDNVPSRDNSFPFTRDASGHWYRPSARTIAHEVGHVLGLGDDYFRTPNADGTSSVTGYKPEAEGIFGYGQGGQGAGGTFTTSGTGKPDPVAIARVIQQMKEAGILPQCWKGTMQATAVYVVDKQRCTDSWSVDMTLITDSDGAASGQAKAQRTAAVKCTYQFPFNPVQSVAFSVEGRRQNSMLQLRFIGGPFQPPGSIDMTGFTGLVQGIGTPKTVDIPIVGKDQARATTQFAWTTGGKVRNGSGQTRLKCTTC